MATTNTIDMDAMLAKIKDRQWALADIDWDAPGAETISEEFRPKLKAFMTDLCWIENIGARGFAALAKKAPTPTIAEIYRYFHAEEQRHANAELALMKRWGMLDTEASGATEDGRVEMPEPNVNIRLAMDWLDRYADDMPLSVLGTVIPMLEVALDGALLKFLLEEVDDPVCHRVFEKINNDESRHIVVDFAVLDMIGHATARRLAIEFVGTVATPALIIGALMYIPLLNRIRNEIVGMGMEPDRLYNAVKRFKSLGERGESTGRVPAYRVLKRHAAMVVNPRHPYHLLANSMVWVSERYPRSLLRPIPSWFKELTYEPAA
ncbi:ferritin-like domain-containing protein [Mycobacterium sp. WMMD1722]|uniref:ferritin-like domain-containing protein n=1 Tax=Mycobacterium sp. WMMD1722 TaxID=3404117 RepID=UPI003BF565DB